MAASHGARDKSGGRTTVYFGFLTLWEQEGTEEELEQSQREDNAHREWREPKKSSIRWHRQEAIRQANRRKAA